MGAKNTVAVRDNSYTSGLVSKIAANSADLSNGTLVKLASGYIAVAAAGDTIEGVSVMEKTFASDNQTVALLRATYVPVVDGQWYTMAITGGTVLTFTGALITANVINMNVNGTALTATTYATSDAATLGVIAGKLVSEFPTLIAAATAGTNLIKITPLPGKTITLTGILVTLGASQVTGSQADALVQADVGKYYDIVTTTQYVDAATESTTTGQLRLERVGDQVSARFSIANL